MAFLSPALVVVVADRAPPMLVPIPFPFFFPWETFPFAFAFAFAAALSQLSPRRDHGFPVSSAPTTG
jgi:hypothetical protein